jgi:hypothetical protein
VRTAIKGTPAPCRSLDGSEGDRAYLRGLAGDRYEVDRVGVVEADEEPGDESDVPLTLTDRAWKKKASSSGRARIMMVSSLVISQPHAWTKTRPDVGLPGHEIWERITGELEEKICFHCRSMVESGISARH